MAFDKHVHKYFKIGDIVKCEVIWGNQLFIVHGFGGNAYLPELYVHFYGKPQIISNICNFDVRMTKLIDSDKRPLKKIDNKIIIKMIKKGNEEAKRELIMRSRK
jgi:hypothetical protein